MMGLVRLGASLAGGGIGSYLMPIAVAGAIGLLAVLGMSIIGDVRDAATLRVRAEGYAKIANANVEALKLRDADVASERRISAEVRAESDERDEKAQARIREIDAAHARAVAERDTAVAARDKALDALATMPDCPKPQPKASECSLDSILPPLPSPR